MNKKLSKVWIALLALVVTLLPITSVQAAKPIILGCPLSTAFLYGWDAERGFKLAVEEINAAGGVSDHLRIG